MLNKTRIRKVAGLLGATAAVVALGAAASPAPASALAEVGSAGTYRIATVDNLAAGSTASRGWNNTPTGRSYFVDVKPIATTVTQACQLEVTEPPAAEQFPDLGDLDPPADQRGQRGGQVRVRPVR